jgi:zinc transport system permease protein
MFDDFLEPFTYGFMQNAFLAGVMAAIACGIIGTFVVVKRLVFISGGIAHTSFGGIGLGYYLGFEPMWGAVIFALATAITLGISSLKTKIREDSTIGIMWVMGMAVGIVLIQMTEGYNPDPISVLFGNILLVKAIDLWIMLALIIVILLIISVLYKELLALSFDEEFAKISGIRTGYLYILLLCLIALTVVVLIKIVGVILVIALLTVPAAIASLFSFNMKRIMAIATGLGLIFTIGGLLLSWEYDLPAGATIVLLAGLFFIVALGVQSVRARIHHNHGPKAKMSET